jgi:hypothetical protein
MLISHSVTEQNARMVTMMKLLGERADGDDKQQISDLLAEVCSLLTNPTSPITSY